jgi:acyl-CoA synthetase (NDP forming)/GNAT superfamily N-acetyltransferase
MGATVLRDDLGSYALLTDGACVQIRAAGAEDWQAVHDFGAALERESVYRRFFGFPKYPGKTIADAVCAPVPDTVPAARGALLALLGERVVGLAEWIRADDPDEAELAFAVEDGLHGHGVATLLAEHLLDVARRVGLRRFVAITQADNRAMLNVFASLGIAAKRVWDEGTWSLSIDLELGPADREALLDVEARRERIADDASLRQILQPSCVAVIGDPHDPATRTVHDNLRAFAGRVETSGPDGGDLPPDVRIDLAVITSPPAAALQAARACARHKAHALIVTATGFDPPTGRALLAVCRGAGMRLLGPGSLGLAELGGDTQLNATLAAIPMAPGHTGIAVQSGGVGLALLSHLTRLGIGVSSFVAVGEKYDLSANDLLMHWELDPDTRLGLLHVESFGSPRKFARTARRLSHRIPLLAVDPEQSPSQARTALYAQAGITTVPSLGALTAAAALLTHQPAPRSRRVAVLGNTHGMVSLASAACVRAGLDIVTAANISPDADARRLHQASTDAVGHDACDALLVALAPTARHAPIDAFSREGIPEDVALLVVLVDQPETVAMRTGVSGCCIPSYNDAEVAAQALGAAAAAAVRRTSSEPPPPDEPAGIDHRAAAGVIEGCLADTPRGRVLYPLERAALLEAFGIRCSAAAPPPTAAHTLTATAWQDSVFGPLLTCARGSDSTPAAVLLAPASARDLTDLAVRALGAPVPGSERLAALLARVAALIDSCPQVATACLTIWIDDSGVVCVEPKNVTVAPADRADPYLRRLRRAPVE